MELLRIKYPNNIYLMPSRKRSPMKKNGTCKHCGKRTKGGGIFDWLGLGNKPTVPTTAPAPAPTAPNTEQPQTAVPVTPPTNEGEGKPIEKTGPGGRGGSEPKPLFGFMGGKRRKSKKSKNSKSKKSKK